MIEGFYTIIPSHEAAQTFYILSIPTSMIGIWNMSMIGIIHHL